MNDEVKKNILQMFGKIPEAMLIINNGIYCDAETDGMFYYTIGWALRMVFSVQNELTTT